MKTIVYSRDFEELEIRPQPVIEEYRRLTAAEIGPRLIEPGALVERLCPGCRADKSTFAFEKFAMEYRLCSVCGSVFVSPCPSDRQLIRFFRDSAAAQFWRDSLAKQTGNVRRKKIYGPLAEWIVGIIDRHCPRGRESIDIGYHSGPLLEELCERHAFKRIQVTNPISDIECAGIAMPAIELRPTSLDQVAQLGAADVILSFDILNCISNTEALFESARAALSPGGLLLLNAISISGFDLQTLWNQSPNIFPPDRLNLLSTEGLADAVERHGFQLLEFSTPGMFDVDVVRRKLADDPNLECSKFVRYLVMNRDSDTSHDFQEFLQRHRLSSFVRLALRKP
jgi:hypothetical protein